MDRRQVMRMGVLVAGAVAVGIALLVFKVRVAVAGGKYVIVLIVILAGIWMLARALKPPSKR